MMAFDTVLQYAFLLGFRAHLSVVRKGIRRTIVAPRVRVPRVGLDASIGGDSGSLALLSRCETLEDDERLSSDLAGGSITVDMRHFDNESAAPRRVENVAEPLPHPSRCLVRPNFLPSALPRPKVTLHASSSRDSPCASGSTARVPSNERRRQERSDGLTRVVPYAPKPVTGATLKRHPQKNALAFISLLALLLRLFLLP